jgi:hypothetical protein
MISFSSDTGRPSPGPHTCSLDRSVCSFYRIEMQEQGLHQLQQGNYQTYMSLLVPLRSVDPKQEMRTHHPQAPEILRLPSWRCSAIIPKVLSQSNTGVDGDARDGSQIYCRHGRWGVNIFLTRGSRQISRELPWSALEGSSVATMVPW